MSGKSEIVFADFMGQQHIVTDRGRWPELVSTRCADMENVTLRVISE